MKAYISKSKITGGVDAPSSKSYTLRGLICAALASGWSSIIFPLVADDTEAAREVLKQIGVTVDARPVDWYVGGGGFKAPADDLFCHESAATLRFMTAIGSIVPGRSRLTAGPSLARRPVQPLVDALRQLGVECHSEGGMPPVTVDGGELKGGLAELPGDISSQFISALLLVAPLAKEKVIIKLTTALESKPYVLMTLECMMQFGIKIHATRDLKQFEISPQTYHPAQYVVEGDWSSASYLMALGAVSGKITINNLNTRSLQGDRVILDYLKLMGAVVEDGDNIVSVKKAPLKAIEADLQDCTDLLPTVAVLAATAAGTSKLTGISRARLKESDRVTAVREGLEKMGVGVVEEEDALTITGLELHGANIDSRSDHRIAMAFSILGTKVGKTVIEKAECVNKTYPEFWETLSVMGGRVRLK